MDSLVIEVGTTGVVRALHSDKFDLGFLGPKSIERQTEIRFNEDVQKWDIHYLITGGYGDTVNAPSLNNFEGYEEARKFEVLWVNACRLHQITPEDHLGLAYAAFLRFGPQGEDECFTLSNGECIADHCIHTRRAATQEGFTLIEVAIVLAILSALLMGMVLPLSARNTLEGIHASRALLTESVDAIKGFAASSGRIPCPATGPLRPEEPLTAPEEGKPFMGGPCAIQSGYLPGVTLGVLSTDSWGRPIRYAVATKESIRTSPECPTDVIYPDSAATTPGGLAKVTMGCLVTDLHACSNGGATYILAGGETCPLKDGMHTEISDNLMVAIWSEGPSTTTDKDDIVIWPALPAIHVMLAAGGYL